MLRVHRIPGWVLGLALCWLVAGCSIDTSGKKVIHPPDAGSDAAADADAGD